MPKRSLESPAGPSNPQKKPKTYLGSLTDTVKAILFRGSEEGSLLDDVARADQERSQPFRALQPGDAGFSSNQPIDLTLESPQRPSPPPPSRFLAAQLTEDSPPPSRALASYPSPQPWILFEPGSLRGSTQENQPPAPLPLPIRAKDQRPDVKSYNPSPRRRKWTGDSAASDHSSSSTSSPTRRRRSQRSNLRQGQRNLSKEFVRMSQATEVPEQRINSGLLKIPRGNLLSHKIRYGPGGVTSVGLNILDKFKQGDSFDAYKHLIASSERTERKPQSYSETLKHPQGRQHLSPSASSSQSFVSSLQAVRKEAARHPRGDRELPDLLQQFHLKDQSIDKSLKSRRTWIPAELPKEKEKYVRSALQNPSFSAKCLREEVKAPDLRRLKSGQWLNDEVINFYGALLQKRADDSLEGKGPKRKVHYFSSFFYKKLSEEGYEKGRLKRWAKKIDLFEKDIILFPININNVHWTCGAINLKDKRFEYYDSMGSQRKDVYNHMRSYIQAEHQEKKGSKLDLTGWTDYWNEDSPQQDNAFDCGVFSCITLEALARGREPTDTEFEFGQDHMEVLRKLMIWEIGHAELVPRA